MSKITVISHRGKLVGVWLPPLEAPAPNTPVCRPIAGPGQKVHELEVKDAETFHHRGKSDELDKLVKKRLKLK